MMQQVASTKADVAAFATLQGANAQAESSSAFEQVLKQQQNPEPFTKPASSRVIKVKGDGRTPVSEVEHKTSAVYKTSNPNQAENSAEKSSVAVLKAHDDTQQSSEVSQKQRADIIAKTKNDNQQKSATSEKSAKDELTSLDKNNDEQALAKSTQQWIDLVWSLQELSVDAGQSDGEEIVNPLEIDSIQALQDWLEPLDDKLQALAQLMEVKPEVQRWLAAADLNQSAELSRLYKQVLDAQLAIKSTAKADLVESEKTLLQVSSDIAAVLKNNRLSPQEIELLKQALVKSLNENTSLGNENKDSLAEKQEYPPLSGTENGNKAKGILGDMPIIFVPTRDKNGEILEASATKPDQASKEDLQALLDKISGVNKTSTEPNANIKISSDSLTTQQAELASALLNKQREGESLLSKTMPATSVDLASASGQPNSANVNAQAIDKITASNAEIKALLALSNDELDAALASVAQRIAMLLRDETQQQSKATNKSINDAGILSSVNTSSKDILAALKAGVAEFKDQLAAGHEPGLDLKALVAQAIDKTGDSAVVVKAANELDKIVRTLSQSLTAINQINDSGSIHQALNTAAIDSQVTQAEQYKAMQLNQFDNKLDKALNLHKPESHQQLADKVRWMVNTGNLIAEIRLDPAELGSMHVKVSLSAESATVNFVVQSQQTRDALEAATPKLREMLAEKGIELGQSTVKQDSQTKQDNQGQAGQQAKNGSDSLATNDALSDEEALLMGNSHSTNTSANSIDYFV
jgi:flagellar hook-length control protein FliK